MNYKFIKALKINIIFSCGIMATALLTPYAALAQTSTTPGDENWRFKELETLLYKEEADRIFTQAQSELPQLEQRLTRQYNATGLTRLSQYNCPSRVSLPVVNEHVDTNITTARIYHKYGHYFLCIRAFEDAMDTLSKAIPLYQKGYGRESLLERSDPQYINEIRNHYDVALRATMQLIEASGAQQSYANAQNLTNQYWPRRNESGAAIVTMRSNVINAWEDAIRLLNLLGMDSEEEDARRRLRLILTFDAD